MPELPEVEVVRAGLERHVVGSTIESVEVLHPRPVRRDHRGPTGFVAALVGQRIVAVRRRGKYFWLALAPTDGQETGDALLGHLGMSGQMLLHEPGAPDERHLRVRFTLVGPVLDPARAPAILEMRFVDQRMFGGLVVSEGGADLPTEIVHIARDPIDPAFDDAEFVRRARRRTSAIKRLLLDQGLISGVGNIYADEALWRARLHGERPGDRLTGPVLRDLLGHVRAVMGEALAQGGTSFDALYVNVNGESGYFDRSLDAYGQEGSPCGRCGTPIRRVAFMNRSSYFCPSCQRPPRPDRDAPVPVDPPRPRWDSWRRPSRRPLHPDPVERHPMAKALMGHVTTELHSTTALTVENRRLRRRVQDLESMVLRLQADNDRLSAAARDESLTVEDLQPA